MWALSPPGLWARGSRQDAWSAFQAASPLLTAATARFTALFPVSISSSEMINGGCRAQNHDIALREGPAREPPGPSVLRGLRPPPCAWLWARGVRLPDPGSSPPARGSRPTQSSCDLQGRGPAAPGTARAIAEAGGSPTLQDGEQSPGPGSPVPAVHQPQAAVGLLGAACRLGAAPVRGQAGHPGCSGGSGDQTGLGGSLGEGATVWHTGQPAGCRDWGGSQRGRPGGQPTVGGGDPRRVEGRTGGLQGRWSARGQTWIVCGWQRAGHPDHQAPQAGHSWGRSWRGQEAVGDKRKWWPVPCKVRRAHTSVPTGGHQGRGLRAQL